MVVGEYRAYAASWSESKQARRVQRCCVLDVVDWDGRYIRLYLIILHCGSAQSKGLYSWTCQNDHVTNTSSANSYFLIAVVPIFLREYPSLVAMWKMAVPSAPGLPARKLSS